MKFEQMLKANKNQKELVEVAKITKLVQINLNLRTNYLEIDGERIAGTGGTTLENYKIVIRGIWDGWKISLTEIRL
jgi:hypothetical protein